MKFSHYIKIFPCKDASDDLIVFSTRKISKIRVSRKTFYRIETGDVTVSETELLAGLGILVEDREAEKAAVCDMFSRMNADNPDLDIIAVMNLDCNFSCLYCYEGDPEGDRYMSAQTADQLVAFIKKRLTPKKTSLAVSFYGGEPLLSLGRVAYIAKALKRLTEAAGIAFSFSLVTNGSLLKRPVAERLVPLGLRSAKITLDGLGPNHDRYRPFKSGAGSFDILVRNIKDVCDLVKIGIGGNYDKDSWLGFVPLLDFLEAEGLGPDILYMVKFDPIISPADQKHILAKYKGGCSVAHEPWILEADRVLRKEILKRGYFTPKIQPIMCAIENKDTFVVNFDGKLFKCPAFTGHGEFSIGELTGDIADYSQTYRLDLWKNEKCLACVYLPLCFGGCRYMSYLRDDGVIDAVECKIPYFDAALETLVFQDIERKK